VIAVSWVLLAAAVVSLVYGLTREGLTFIYVSIGASVGAMLFLLGGILRKRPVQPATAGAPYGPPPGTETTGDRPTAASTLAPPAPARRKAATRSTTSAPTRAPAKPTARKSPARKSTVSAPQPQRATAKKTTAKKTAPATSSSGRASTVVALPERGTYHEAGCRFVRGKRDTERLSMTTAKRRGYKACGVCKPED
jgi:hypothetical protein